MEDPCKPVLAEGPPCLNYLKMKVKSLHEPAPECMCSLLIVNCIVVQKAS